MGRVIDMPAKNYTSASAAMADTQRHVTYLLRKRTMLTTSAVTDSQRLHDHIQNLGKQIDMLDQLAETLGCGHLAAPPLDRTKALRSGLLDATKILNEAIADLTAGTADISENI